MKRRHHRIPGLATIPDLIGFPGGRGSFSPASIFAAGAHGAWFRPSQFETRLYNDQIGSNLLTAVSQTAGLVLDHSANFTIGAELVSNGNFDTDISGWSVNGGGASAIWTSNGIQVTRAQGSADVAWQAINGLTVGKYYQISFTVVSGGGAGVRIGFSANLSMGGGGTFLAQVSSNGSYTRLFYASGTTRNLLIGPANNGTCVVDNVSVREFAGNHAFQNTALNRPTLRQEAGSGAFFLEDDGTDSLNWYAPAGTYTVAYVIPNGTVTILTGQALNGATNILLATQVVEYLAFNRALTTEETAAVTAYLQSVALP